MPERSKKLSKQDKLIIREITETIIHTQLLFNNIQRGSRDWNDYEKAKRIVFRREMVNPFEYEIKIQIIEEYLQI